MGKITSFLKTVGILLLTRALPALTLAILFCVVAVQIDRWQVNNAAASDYVNYTAFDVTNARAGEDVYFKVCRDHQENYTYSGALTVYIYRDADPKSTPTKVYSKDIGGSIRTNCENKVLRASDFSHSAGTYKMAFCIDFYVKYNTKKTACKDSNIYKIYPQPTDLNDQLQYYQNQIDILNEQIRQGGQQGVVNTPNSLAVPQNQANRTAPSNIGTPSQTPANNGGGNAAGNGQTGGGNAAPAQPTCAVGLFGGGLFCGSDGLLRL